MFFVFFVKGKHINPKIWPEFPTYVTINPDIDFICLASTGSTSSCRLAACPAAGCGPACLWLHSTVSRGLVQ